MAIDKEIGELDVSVRAWNCVDKAGVRSLFELAAYSEDEFKKKTRAGIKSIRELRRLLSDNGLSFSFPVTDEELRQEHRRRIVEALRSEGK